MQRKQTAYQFFKQHAGYSYGGEETPEAGRRRCARALAHAEAAASAAGATFDWVEDIEPFQCYCDDATCESHAPHLAYECLARDEHGEVFASLSGISFGPGGSPHGEPYRRVVEAELAVERYGK